MARKVTVFLRGGLGNQMFQYAAGFDLAKRSNAQLVLDTTFLNDRFPRKEFTFRTYDLDILGIDTDFTVLSKISGAIPIPGLWLGLDLALAKIKNFLGVQKIIKEPSVTSAGISATQGSVLLFGYWQNEKYFSGTKDDLRTIFNVSIPLEGAAEEIAEKMRNTNSVAVFVRRGDYVKFASVRAQMGDTSVAYYQSAAAYIAEHVDHPTFFVFSDDIEWCEENLKIPFSTTYVPNTQEMIGPKFAYRFQHMAICKHSIIANSTFSWWTAWLGKDPKKIVVAPQKWNVAQPEEGNPALSEWIKL